jgi:hypothetical protein
MEHAPSDIFSLQWWISVGVVAVLLHMIGLYGVRATDRVLGALWGGAARRLRRQAHERTARIQRASEDVLAFGEMCQRETRLFFRGILMFIVVFGMLPWVERVESESHGWSQGVIALLMLCILIGVGSLLRTSDVERELREAAQLRRDAMRERGAPLSPSP